MVQTILNMECALCGGQFNFCGMFTHMEAHPSATLSDMYIIVDDENIEAVFSVYLRKELRNYINGLAKQGVMVDVLLKGDWINFMDWNLYSICVIPCRFRRAARI